MNMEESLYLHSFSKVRNYLENSGIDIIKQPPYRPIKSSSVYISSGSVGGNVTLDEDGMFVVEDSDGVKRKVFLVKKAMYFVWEGQSKQPKAHLCKCQKVSPGDYKYANSLPVTVFDRYSREDISLSNIELCSYCSSILEENNKEYFSNIGTMEKFVDYLKSVDVSEVSFAGYVKNWDYISHTYRELKGYKCENCGIDLSDFQGRYYCQVHHINGNKLDNNPGNFRCLCVSCHSKVDDHHKKNFSTKANQELLKAFEKYKEKNEK